VVLDVCRGREDGAEQSADNAVAGVQEEAEQARVPHAVVGSAARRLCQPVPVHLCLQELRLQVRLLLPPTSSRLVPSVRSLAAVACGNLALLYLFSWPCRNRAFAYLFTHGASEELSSLQVVEAHAFPQHFSEMKTKVGLAPAAIVSSRGSDNSVLKSLDANRPIRPSYPLIGKFLSCLCFCSACGHMVCGVLNDHSLYSCQEIYRRKG
jgi:hypothetical protein